MHKTYTNEMNRKAHRYALLKAAKEDGEINWGFTERDWTALKVSDTGSEMLVSVKVGIDREKYFKYREQYEKAQKMRDAKKK